MIKIIKIYDKNLLKDWRKNGCVGPVRDQGPVCSTISEYNSAESIAGINCVKNGNFTAVSAQQILDCSTGCSESSFEQSKIY